LERWQSWRGAAGEACDRRVGVGGTGGELSVVGSRERDERGPPDQSLYRFEPQLLMQSATTAVSGQ